MYNQTYFTPACATHFTEEDSVDASEAIVEVVDALTGCRFEETQRGHDEAVRARIMKVMVACLEGGVGTWLPDEVVWEVLQTCMANLDQMVREGESERD